MELRKKVKVDYTQYEDDDKIIALSDYTVKKRRPKFVNRDTKFKMKAPLYPYYNPTKVYRVYSDLVLPDKFALNTDEIQEDSAFYGFSLVTQFRSIVKVDANPDPGYVMAHLAQNDLGNLSVAPGYVIDRYLSYGKLEYKEIADRLEEFCNMAHAFNTNFMASKHPTIRKLPPETEGKLEKPACESETTTTETFEEKKSPSESADSSPLIHRTQPQLWPLQQSFHDEILGVNMPRILMTYAVTSEKEGVNSSQRSFAMNKALMDLLGFSTETCVYYLIQTGIPPVFTQTAQASNVLQALSKMMEWFADPTAPDGQFDSYISTPSNGSLRVQCTMTRYPHSTNAVSICITLEQMTKVSS
jgi:hypothetical protein